jgi:class 3 adenylate cyclase
MAKRRTVGSSGLGDKLREAITARFSASLSEQLRDQPEAIAKLIELNLVDPALLEDPDTLDLTDTIRRFRDLIAERAAIEPSVLAQLEVRPLEVMRSEEPIHSPANNPSETPLTVVFSDLEGFTSFTSVRGDLEASALLADHYDAVEAITRSRGGHVVKKIGDGHMLSFSEPSAAVMASLDLTAAAPQPLRLRAGAHRGAVIQTAGDLIGHVVNVASRVTDTAAGGVSLITREVRQGAGRLPRVEYTNTRSVELDGLTEDVEVSEVTRL